MLGSSKISRMQTKSLNSITANIMIADVDLNIRYMNEAVTTLLKEAAADLKKELPRFDFDKLVGSNIDIFHKNPSHQRNMLSALKTQHRATIWVGHRAFDLIVTPLLEGNRTTGFVVEWANAKERLQNVDFQGQMVAISRVQGIIEFTTDGEIVTANENFLNALGYRLDEIKGGSHSMLVDPEYARSPAYKDFWDALRRGEFQAAEFTRYGKNGKLVVINASYNPILDSQGQVTKIVKFATDVTERVHAVTTIGAALTRLAEGDLSFSIDQPFAPDFEGLRNAMNEALSQMRNTLSDVAGSTNQIDTGTREISQSAEDLSKRTEQQAASLEETAAALDQITVNVSNASKRAEEPGLLPLRQAKMQSAPAKSLPMQLARCPGSRTPRTRFQISSALSMRLPSRPISWHSTQVSRPLVPVKPERVLQSSRKKYASLRNVPHRQPRKLRA